VAVDAEETVHVTASRWWQRGGGSARNANSPRTRAWATDSAWTTSSAAHDTTAALDAHRVDTFRGELEAAGLSPHSVNMILDPRPQILDDAVEYELLAANRARGKRRRLKAPKPARSFLEPDMVVDLLHVAEEREWSLPPHQRYGRRAFLASCSSLHGSPSPRRRPCAVWISRQWPRARAEHGRRHRPTSLKLSAFLVDELRAHVELRPAPYASRTAPPALSFRRAPAGS
jgi:hypothetical protein